MSVRVVQGDCREVMAGMEACSVDAIVTDPPYGLEFMGVAWDTFSDRPKGTPRTRNEWGDFGSREHPRDATEQASIMGRKNRAQQRWHEDWTTLALRVLKPGAHLLAFGGTRTYHRLVCAIEDAGFEIRDSIHWLYGSGFPKSLNLDGEWLGWGTALKPGHEPIVLARKPLAEGTVAANVAVHGTGALNIDACRVATDDSLGGGELKGTKPVSAGWDRPWRHDAEVSARKAVERAAKVAHAESLGRWPANVVLSHSAACASDECAPDCPVAELDRQSGMTGGKTTRIARRPRNAGWVNSSPGEGVYAIDNYGDEGGAARFFYCAKADRSERDALWGELPQAASGYRPGDPDENSIRTRLHGSRARVNHHPTVKPVDLMRWLCRLVTPPRGIVLDPFAGSGSTGVACVYEDFSFTGIEQEVAYVEIARARLAHALGPLFSDEAVAR